MASSCITGRRRRAAGLLLLLTAAAPASPAGPADQPWKRHTIDQGPSGADGVKIADVNADGLPDVATGWTESGITRVYLHPGYAQVRSRWPAVTVGSTPSVEDAVFADLDGDGAREVIASTQDARILYVHWPPEDPGNYLVAEQWQQQPIPSSVGRMPWMNATAMDIDGRHGVDIVAGGHRSRGILGWLGRAQLGWFEIPADPRHTDRYVWHAITEVRWLMSLLRRDMDGDGDTDLVITDRYGPQHGSRWLENPGSNSRALRKPWASHPIGATGHEVLDMTLTDLDGDGLEDVLAAVRDHRVIVSRRLDSTGRNWEEYAIKTASSSGNPRAIAVTDVNLDGQPDLVLTTFRAQDRHGVIWLSYENAVTDTDWTFHTISGSDQGIKYDRIEILDMDGDGDPDVLTTEEDEGPGHDGLGVIWYENPYL